MTESRDIWADWVLRRRFGSTPDAERLRAAVEPIRDTVLDHAAIAEHETLVDVGCGDGLIGFGALARAPTATVVFSDISQDLLDETRRMATEAGVLKRCRFVRAPVEDLSAIESASVDVVTMRSVLIYVKDKSQALRECWRVLNDGGRLSLFEPINAFRFPEPDHMLFGYDVTPVMALAQRVKAVFSRIQDPASDPMFDFDEHSLLTIVEESGFVEIHLEARFDVKPETMRYAWETLLNTAGNPRIPTLGEALSEALAPAEREAFVAHLRPLVERRQRKVETEVVYLWAVKKPVRQEP